MAITLTNESKNTAITLTDESKGSSPRYADLPTTSSAPFPATWESEEDWETHKTFLTKEVKNTAITLTDESKN